MEERLIALEIRYTHVERQLEELNHVVFEQPATYPPGLGSSDTEKKPRGVAIPQCNRAYHRHCEDVAAANRSLCHRPDDGAGSGEYTPMISDAGRGARVTVLKNGGAKSTAPNLPSQPTRLGSFPPSALPRFLSPEPADGRDVHRTSHRENSKPCRIAFA